MERSTNVRNAIMNARIPQEEVQACIEAYFSKEWNGVPTVARRMWSETRDKWSMVVEFGRPFCFLFDVGDSFSKDQIENCLVDAKKQGASAVYGLSARIRGLQSCFDLCEEGQLDGLYLTHQPEGGDWLPERVRVLP